MNKKKLWCLVLSVYFAVMLAFTAFADEAGKNTHAESVTGNSAGKTLVVFFSATGTTKGVAEKIASVAEAGLYEIIPTEPYTAKDLNYNDSSSRATREQNEGTARPGISGNRISLEGCKTIFIGYPIWWGKEPRIMDTFVETYNFDGITVIPFCTSGSSGIGMSGKNLEANAGSGTWLDGKRFSGNVSEGEIASWISSLPIVKQRDLADADITVMDAKYTGSALEPAVEVVLDGDLLAQGTDYTVFYSDNVNAGKGSVKITGTGDYTGSANAEFTISPASISGAAISGVKNKVYTGKNLTQAVTVKVGSKKLQSGTDYTESYANSRNIGTATLTVKGKGNYTGTVSTGFKILPKATGISNLASGRKSFTVRWKKQATQTSGYMIQYSTDKNFRKDVKSKRITKVNTTKAAISGLTGNKMYYVRICTFRLVNNRTYSSAWSKSKSVTTKN